MHLLRATTLDKLRQQPNEQIYPENTILEFENILKLSKDFTKEKGTKFYFVYLPDYLRYQKKNQLNDATYDYQKIIQMVNDLGIPIIDINRELFKKHEDPLSLFPFRANRHYNELGYKLIAEIIFKKINDYERINN